MKKKPVKKKAPKKKAAKKRAPQKSKPVKKKVAAVAGDNFGFDTLEELGNPGFFAVIYSPPGFGKTTLAAHFEKVIFTITAEEQGIKKAIEHGVVPSTVSNWIVELDPVFDGNEIPRESGHPGWIKLTNTIKHFAEEDHDRQTLVLDTTSGAQSLCHQHCASKLYDGNMTAPDGYMNYYEGYIKAAEEFWQRELLTQVNKAVARGLNVVMLAHSSVKNMPNPSGLPVESHTPDLDKRIWNFTKKAAHAILFMGESFSHTTDKATRKAKATGSERFIGVGHNTFYEAKNWMNLSEDIEVGTSAKETYNNLKTAFNL